MATVTLVRHGQPDWALIEQKGFHGGAADLAPLNRTGVAQAIETAERLRGAEARMVVSSPMTRALQTASIISSRLELALAVEFDLREWMPHTGFGWHGLADVLKAYDDMLAAGPGGRPVEPFRWEPLNDVRARSMQVLRRHICGGPVIAVCHEVVIHALTGHRTTPMAGVRELRIDGAQVTGLDDGDHV